MDKGVDAKMETLVLKIHAFATRLDFFPDNNQGDPGTFNCEDHRTALEIRDAEVKQVLLELDRVLDLRTARELLEWLTAHHSNGAAGALSNSQVANIIRLLQYKTLSAEPIQTELHGSRYEWAGDTLQRLFGSEI